MSEVLTKQELAVKLLELLSQTDFDHEQSNTYVNRLFEPFKWEGVPYVEMENGTYIVTIYERGMPMLKKKLKQTEMVIYWLLEDIIFTTVHVEMLKKYDVDNINTHLKYTSEVIQEMDHNVTNAFQQLGEPYLHWHQTGKRHELESMQPSGRDEGHD
ncbi:immunity 63 family protein [Paenibacillus sp. CC-CFT742]|nr:Imm63 family immunity protein [Paenibacillus sp. CC-CFT742]WJH28837.1 immunity 63 family protein [Paenibacillus sp. CC-CFT742]